ncbi:MAG: heavy metal translocating P-type ATPase [Eubacteriales bacterium]|nr:heavy metal translocating P-type ATPase [Eubacteriales bacterium]
MTRKQRKMLIRIIISAVLLLGLTVFEHFISIDYAILRTALYLVPYFVIGYDILIDAVRGLINRQPFDENFLMAVASVGAIAIAIYDNGSYSEGVLVVLLYQIGELFQSVAVGKSRRNIAKLMDIRPDYANVELDGVITSVDPQDVEIGSVIVVSAGEKIPIDGTVIDGKTSLDTSALTGEALPKEVEAGDSVLSGCINLSGTIRIKTEKLFGQSTVSKILELVESSASKKAKSEQFITKFARYYTPSVCALSFAIGVLVPLVLMISGNSAEWSKWIYRALTFLVISCPCALVISVPLSFFAGIGGATKSGILIKGSNYIETLSKVKTVIFDKTGTLTRGAFEVKKINTENGFDEDSLLEYCAIAEAYSSHPIAKSLVAAYKREIDFSRLSDVEEIGGNGIKACVEGKTVLVGNKRLMNKMNIDYTECLESGTVAYAAINGEYAGSIVIGDVVKQSSKQALEMLKKLGVSKTVMLTGDNESIAKSVANELKLDEVHFELLPDDKVRITESILEQSAKGEKVAFVGDGINDAPVLTRADIGIAMGGVGSDAAVESADIVIMDDDITKIPKAIKISRKCMRIVYENIYFALGVKALCLVLGALGIADMWLAVFADVGVMIIAVLNSIRSLKNKRN